MMTKIITITNFKGGAGKTTTARNIAEGLAMKGKRVLFIDFDESGNGTESFGIEPGRQSFLAMTQSSVDCVQTGIDNLFLLPGNALLRTVEDIHKISAIPLPEAADILKRFISNFEYAVIDTHPSGYMQSVAIFAAHHVVITTQVNLFSLRGAQTVIGMIKQGVAQYNIHEPNITVLPVMLTRTREAVENYRALAEAIPELVASYPIPFRTEVAEAESRMVSVFQHKRKGDTAMGYCHLIDTELSPCEPLLSEILEYKYDDWRYFYSSSIANVLVDCGCSGRQ